MPTLLLADHEGGSLKDTTHKALTAARALGGPVHVLVAGADGAGSAAAEAARLEGVDKVLLAEDAAFGPDLAEPLAALIVSLASDYDGLVAAATSRGKNVMPRVAALLDVMQLSDVSAVLGPDTFERPVYAGNAIQTVRTRDPVKVVTVRIASFAPAGAGGSEAPVETVSAVADPQVSSFVGAALAQTERPELTSARIIVSGGRALGSAEKFRDVVIPLADKLGAAVGASRAAVDAGYAPNDWQVGQTGKVVAPISMSRSEYPEPSSIWRA
jgi:electron transfer flavoprotein alpha subunit